MIPRVPSRAAEGLLYALLAFGPLAFGCVEPWSRASLEILAFALALACFLRGARPAAGGWAWAVPAGFAALGALQLLTPVAADFPRPAWPFTAAPEATRASILLWTAYAAVLWSVPRVVADHEAARRFARAVFGIGAAVAAQGLLQLATGGGRLYWIRPAANPTIFGPYYNRDHAANLFLLAAGLGAGVALSTARRWPEVDGPPAEYVRSQGRLWGGVALLLAAVAACGSRGAGLAIVLAAAFVGLAGAGFARGAGERRRRAAAALAAAAFAVLFTFRHAGAGADAGALTERPIAERFYLYADSGRWLLDSPVFGTGLGSFETVYPAYQDRDLRAVAEHAHSDWLELALETGLAGLLAALALAGLGAASAVRTWLGAGSREMRALVGGALAAAAAFAFHSVFEFGFQIPGNAIVFFAVAGFLASAPAWADKAASRPRPAPPSAWTAAAGLAGFVWLALAAAAPSADSKALRRAGAELFARASGDEAEDAPRLRSALSLALASAELRPFDYRALRLSGRVLARLGRADDAGELLSRSELVGFAPVVVGGGRAESWTAPRRLDALKKAGIALPKERP